MALPSRTPRVDPAYAELHCLSNFSFQRGASQPQELVERAHALGYRALALTDECSVAGVVRAHEEARRLHLQLIPGAEFAVPVGATVLRLVALPHNLQGWGNLCEFITMARRGAAKGQYRVDWHNARWDLLAHCDVLLVVPAAMTLELACSTVLRASQRLCAPGCLWLACHHALGPDDALQSHRLAQISQLSGVPMVATGNVHMHVRSRKPLHDALTAVRCGKPIAQCGFELQANAELHLRSRQRIATLYPPELLANTLVIAQRCQFSLDALRYQYPMEAVLPGHTPAQTLRHYAQEGAHERYAHGVPESVRVQMEHELALIA
jgi:error-prone DNA polymerase